MSNVRELAFIDDPAVPVLYACGTCGVVSSPKHYGGGEIGHAQARSQAESCSGCRPARQCAECQEDAEKGYTVCSACRHRLERERVSAKIARAIIDTSIEECFSAYGSAFYQDVESAAEAGETVVYGSTFVPFRIDPDALIENILDNHHEDASRDDLRGVGRLMEAVVVFNRIQTSGSYEIDEGRYMKIKHDRTFAMIKPDATARGIEDQITTAIRDEGFQILLKETRILTRSEAEWLYDEHRSKSHFGDLVEFTISGPVVLMVVKGEYDDVPTAFRTLIGAAGNNDQRTLRGRFGISVRENSIHGSDSPRSAIGEICRFFPQGYQA